jgi:hypothetical protein
MRFRIADGEFGLLGLDSTAVRAAPAAGAAQTARLDTDGPANGVDPSLSAGR